MDHQSRNMAPLTDEDIELVKLVYEMTTSDDEPGVIIFKGPETDHLFPDQDYTHMPKIGGTRVVHPSAGAGAKSLRMVRHVERHFVGSDVFGDEGIPIGAWDRYLPKVAHDGDNSLFFSDTRYDISAGEMERLYSLAHGLHRMSPQEKKRHEKKMRVMRARQQSPDQSDALKALGDVIGGQIANALETQKTTRTKRGRQKVAQAVGAAEGDEE